MAKDDPPDTGFSILPGSEACINLLTGVRLTPEQVKTRKNPVGKLGSATHDMFGNPVSTKLSAIYHDNPKEEFDRPIGEHRPIFLPMKHCVHA